MIDINFTYQNRGPSWSWCHDRWIYYYLCNLCLSPLLTENQQIQILQSENQQISILQSENQQISILQSLVWHNKGSDPRSNVFVSLVLSMFMVSFVFCDSMWSFWVEANMRVCLFVYYRWRSSYPDLAGSDSIKWFNKDLHLQRHMSYVMVLFVFSELRWEFIVSFIDIDEFFYHQCLTFLSIITRIVSCNPVSNILSVIK